MMLLLLLCVCDAEDFVEDVADAPGDVAAAANDDDVNNNNDAYDATIKDVSCLL